MEVIDKKIIFIIIILITGTVTKENKQQFGTTLFEQFGNLKKPPLVISTTIKPELTTIGKFHYIRDNWDYDLNEYYWKDSENKKKY